MNAQQFLTWMRNPGKTSREESAQLDALLDAFPYFQSGHLLYIKNLHNEGSFLYNNQLKTAAAYAVNRKVLYNLITLKTGDERQDTGENIAELAVRSTPSTPEISKTGIEQPKVEEVSEPIKFPPKKFTSNPDEWEAGMLRQLQLLHHWRKSGETSTELPVHNAQLSSEAPKPKETPEQKIPDAKEEINTLLYVLVEPGQPEDMVTDATEEVADQTEESENTQWQITPAVEDKPETVQEIQKPEDAVQQEILVEAIHSTFELEVDDHLPTVDELKPFRIEPKLEEVQEVEQTPVTDSEEVVSGFENMSFSEWVQEVNKKKVPAELPKTALSGDKLIEQFIKEQPRIQVKKSGFFNPVNMAKKSVQDSDEFITETLARIYAKQGNHPKAIRAYQKLSLKFPEKTAYFAALIEELKRTPNK